MPNTESTAENTTTTTENTKNGGCCGGELTIIFPNGLLITQRRALTKLLVCHQKDAQAIIDELAGRMKISDVKNPVGYVRGIIRNIGEDGFEPELGLAISEARDSREKQRRIMQKRESIKDMEKKAEAKTLTPDEYMRNMKNIIGGRKPLGWKSTNPINNHE